MKKHWSSCECSELLENNKVITEYSKEIVQDVLNESTDLSNVVEKLEKALTSTDVDQRSNGTQLLSEILTQIPADFLNEPQLNYMCTFYCDRLKDHHSILPNVFIGLLSLVKMINLPEGMCNKILTTIFQHVSCQSQLREDRANMFLLIKIMTETKSKEISVMGPDFIYGVINMIDGERDPRNLIFLFQFMPTFVKTFPLGHLSEEMFEVFACYFPIDFYPAQNDPASITRDNLAEYLSDCLCCDKTFTENCINLLLEKLESDLVIAKLDSLNLLTKAAINFDCKDIDEHFEKIWLALKKELLPGHDKDITKTALQALECLLTNAKGDEKIIENYLNTIFNTILMSLIDVKAKLFIPATNIALSCANTTDTATIYVSKKLLPLLLSQIECEHNDFDEQVILYDLLEKIISISAKKNLIKKIDSAYFERAQTLFIKCLTDNNEHLYAVTFQCLTEMAELILPENRIIIYLAIKNCLTNGLVNESLKVCLRKFATIEPNEIEEYINTIINYKYKNDKDMELSYNCITTLIDIEFFTELIINYLISEVFTETIQLNNNNKQIICIKCLERINDNNIIINDLYKKRNIIEKIYIYINNSNNIINIDNNLLKEFSNILNTIVKQLTNDEQTLIINNYLKELTFVNKSDIYFIYGILGYISKDIDLSMYIDDIINKLINLSLITTDENVKSLCNQLICSLFNKLQNEEKHNEILQHIIINLNNEIKNKHNSRAIEILTWISKALAIKGHSGASEILDTLIDLLDHPTLGNFTSLAFDILSVELPNLHLPIIKYLYKQKLFQIILKKFYGKIEQFGENHLIAFSYILKMLPHQIIKNNLEKISSALFNCLELNNETPVIISLEIINRFCKESNLLMSLHLQYLIPKCIKLTTFENSMKIRIKALECLENICNYKVILLLPYKHDVLYGLVKALDDKKRLVRRAAVATRMKWYQIGEIGDNDTKL